MAELTGEVELTGWIPVTVTVSLNDGAVTSVDAHDTEFKYGDIDRDYADRAALEAELQADHDAHLGAARQIAENTLWPEWSFN